MFDICTVVFRDELPLLKIQAQSLDAWGWRLNPRTIWVIVNDDPDLVDHIRTSWWGGLAPHVRVLPREVFGADWSDNGWVGQQALKLLVPAIGDAEWTMCLDAKTLLVDAVSASTLLDDRGRARVGRCPIYPVFEPSRQFSEEFWNCKLDQQLGPGGVPFLFHNHSTQRMVSATVSRTRKNFATWFQEQPRLTEFIFYSAWIQSQGLDLYAPDSNIRPVNLCHSEVDMFDSKQQQWDQATTVSIHRNAWTRLTDTQRQQYRDFLTQLGITQAWQL